MLKPRIVKQQDNWMRVDIETSIELQIKRVNKIQRYTCPQRLADVKDWSFANGILTVDLPGRYYVEFE